MGPAFDLTRGDKIVETLFGLLGPLRVADWGVQTISTPPDAMGLPCSYTWLYHDWVERTSGAKNPSPSSARPDRRTTEIGLEPQKARLDPAS